MPIRPTPRPVSVAIAAALLLALALSLAAAPSAPAAPASCAQAKKQLLSAKSQLRKAQRRRAPKAVVAKARKRVKRADAARRRACRTPAPPKPSPSPSPSPPPSPAPPAPQPFQPAGDPHPGPPHGEPQPDPPGGDPDPQPGAPTSAELIEKALKEGRIDAETALRYEVFSEFGDARLPDEFRGAPMPQTDTDTLDRVSERWDELSTATRAALDPFFVPPFNPGSWHEPQAQPGAAARTAAVADPEKAPGETLCANTAPNFQRWGYVTAASSKLRIWYENTVAGQQAKAIAVAQHLDSGPYAKLTAALRAPIADGGDLAANRCRGFDPAVDIALTPLGPSGKTIHYPGRSECEGPFPAFALIKRTLTGPALMSTVTHELTHVAQFSYSTNVCPSDVTWLAEATAAWMEDHAHDYGPAHPEYMAPWFLEDPSWPLDTLDRDKTPREYGSYLFFQWLAKTKDPDAIGDVWEATEASGGVVGHLQTVLTQRGFAGGFTEAWKRFAFLGLNPRPEADTLKKWGVPTGAPVFLQELAAGAEETIPVELRYLTAQYAAFEFADDVKGIEVRNPAAGKPGASLQAWLRIEEGGHERVEIVDWSGSHKETLCRLMPGQNVKELALVVANSTHTDRQHVLHDDPVIRTSDSCGNHVANARVTIKYSGVTEVYTAKYPLDFRHSIPLEGGGRQTYFETDDADPGHVTWKISGVTEGGCTLSGSSTLPYDEEHPPNAWLELDDFGADDPRTTYEFSFDTGHVSATVTSACREGTSTYEKSIGEAHYSDPLPFDPDPGQDIVGLSEWSTPGPPPYSIKREWTITTKEIGP